MSQSKSSKSSYKKPLRTRLFFLVLDDMWISDPWIYLLNTPLYAAATGIIILTTQIDTVAVEIGVDHTHRVDLMSTNVGWELLHKSMGIDEEKGLQNLRAIEIGIVQKCGRLPLAVKVIARVLATKDRTANEWSKILRQEAWSMSKLPSEITAALYVSYEDLPCHLKQCFVYCAMYPEDTVIYRDDIVRMWVAEGFIVEEHGKLLEDTAEEYYYDLIYRNLLQPENTPSDLSKCRIHDLLRQLACHLSREECFVGGPESISYNVMSKFRRILVVNMNDMVMLPCMEKEKCKVRTWITTCTKPLRVDDEIFTRFPYIRVLDLTGSLIKTIPSSIRKLIRLRLLDLDGTDISYLPECICCLENLQILNIDRCYSLHSLPSGIIQLSNLRRLGLKNTPIDQVPNGIEKLKFLNDLTGMPIGSGSNNTNRMQDGWNMKELGPLMQLRRLHIIKVERARPCGTNSVLTNKQHLKELALTCTKRTDDPYPEDDVINIEKTFELLIPGDNVEELTFTNFFGRRFPSWLDTATYLPSLKYMMLIDCESCLYLPSIGQLPNLKYLRIQGAAQVTRIGPEFIGCGVGNLRYAVAVAFPKLESLVIEDMSNWEEWTFSVVQKEEATRTVKEAVEDRAAAKQEEAPPSRMQLLPRLKKLYVMRCPKLRALPQQLGQTATSLKVIDLRQVGSLTVVENLPFLSERLLILTCEGLERVSNIPQVTQLQIGGCPNVRRVEELGSLSQVWLHTDMSELSALWVPVLKLQCQQNFGEDLDVYTWIYKGEEEE